MHTRGTRWCLAASATMRMPVRRGDAMRLNESVWGYRLRGRSPACPMRPPSAMTAWHPTTTCTNEVRRARIEELAQDQNDLTLFTRAMSAKTALSEMTVVVIPGTTLLSVHQPQTHAPACDAPALARFSANFWPSNSGADSAMMTL